MTLHNQHIRCCAGMPSIQSARSDNTWQMHEERIMERNAKNSRLYKRLKTALHGTYAWIHRWILQKADMHRLRAMDERQLKDLGLNSGQIASSIEERIDFETRMKYGAKKRQPFS